MSKVSVIFKLVIKEGAKEKFTSAFEAMAETVAGEEGTEIYVLNWDTKNDHIAWIFEVYSDGDALAVHGGSDAMKDLIAVVGDVADGPPELAIATPAFAKGLEL